MDRKLRNWTLILLVIAGIVAFFLIRASGRQPVAKIAATRPYRQSIMSSISSNGKVEPISPYIVRSQSDTFVQKVLVSEGQNVKKGQLLMVLDVKDAAAALASAKSKLLHAQDDLRSAQAGGRSDDAARVAGDLAKAIASRDRLQRDHDALTRLLAQGAATKDELATNELELAKANADVEKYTAAKKEFGQQSTLNASGAALSVQQAQSDVAAL
ncbi:MAG TPA: biotin/lipoyl-binding protein, partial [Candidatus Acidoferrum sp.]|nr:biotin/lipoyl-binding protein [Candidatus Acidoferrum sp.]